MNVVITGEKPLFYRPLIPFTVGLIAGIAFGAALPGYVWPSGGVILVSVMATCRCIKKRRPALIMPLLLCAAAGYLSIQPWLSSRLPPNHINTCLDQSARQIIGTVADHPKAMPGRQRFELNAEWVRNGSGRHRVCGKVLVTTGADAPGLGPGDQIEVSGRLKDIRSYCNPGGFDYARFMALRSIWVRLYANPDKIRIIRRTSEGGWRRKLNQWRAELSRQMETALAAHRPTEVSVLKALIIGDRSGIGPELREAFNRAGVGHVLAISGLHIGMVAASVFAAAVWLLSWIPWMLRNALTRKSAAIFTMLPVVGYAALSGLSPSTQRAALMAAVFLMIFWVGRRHDWLNTLNIAALIILVIYPPSLLSISFQLSFSAVLAIFIGSRLFRRSPPPEQSWFDRLLRQVAALLGVSLLAVLGTLPIGMFYFNQVSPAGPAANLVVVPLVGTLVVPAGLLGVLLSLFHAAAAGLCWQVAAWGVNWMLLFIHTAAAWPYAAVQTVTPSTVEIVLYYLFILVLLQFKRRKVFYIGLAAVIAASGMDAVWWYHLRFARREMIVTAIDVGQGSAHLLELPGGGTVLIDGGGFSDNRMFDVGARILAPLLWRKKIKTIDVIALSHANSDHLNGLLYILEHFNVREVWSNHEPADTFGYRRWAQIIRSRGLQHTSLNDMAVGKQIGGIMFEILSPPNNFMQLADTVSRRDLDNNSLVIRAVFDRIGFLFPGDIDAKAEADLLARVDRHKLKHQIYFAAHHGSRSSNCASFLRAVQPSETIISAGWKNRFKFPHKTVLKRLSAAGCRIWRTDLCGAVQVRTDGIGYRITTCRPCCGNPP